MNLLSLPKLKYASLFFSLPSTKMQQTEFTGAAYYDSLLGRQPHNPPSNFTRVLYVPHHNSKTVHLPIYDVADLYHNAVKGSMLSTSLYSVQLTMMEKPRDDGMNCRVVYHLDLDQYESGPENARLQVQRRSMYKDCAGMAQALIPLSLNDDCLLAMGHHHKQHDVPCMPMSVSYPIQPSILGGHAIPHPFFTFLLPGYCKTQRVVQWQIHPRENSLRRYTLVELERVSKESEESEESDATLVLSRKILAIYHHVGIATWIPAEFSEGVILLPELNGVDDGGQEALIVASILALLWQLRERAPMKPRKLKSRSGSILRRAVSMVRRH